MGLLVKGLWQDQWYETEESKGAFQREDAQLRNWLTADGSAGPTGEACFKRKKTAIIYMYRWLAPGHTAR